MIDYEHQQVRLRFYVFPKDCAVVSYAMPKLSRF